MLEAVIFVLLILAAINAGAQPTGDGVPLLRQVYEAARSAKGWRAEGPLGELTERGPLEMRIDSGRYPTRAFDRTVCDGSEIWNSWYNGISAGGSEGSATETECKFPALQWDTLLDSLLFAVLAGRDDALGCTVVRAEYAAPTGPAIPFIPNYQVRPVTREICVDEASNAILWERFYAGSYVVNLTKIERDPVFGPDEFQIPFTPGRSTGRWLQILGDLPVHFCSGSSPSVGCVKNPFALGD